MELKSLIIRRFNRAAATYDRYADVQREALALLAAELPVDPAARRVLELGCGTGNYTGLLLERFPAARLLSLDFSAAMLEQARRKIAAAGGRQRVDFLCQDAELFLAANLERFDFITANATLQWFADPAAAFARIRAGLAPGGRLLTTIFGRRSLEELAAGLHQATGGRLQVAASNFPDPETLQRQLTGLFAEVAISEQRLEREFADLPALLRHFRYTGTAGAGGGAVTFSRRHYRELAAWFQRQPGGYRLSFQVLVVNCRG